MEIKIFVGSEAERNAWVNLAMLPAAELIELMKRLPMRRSHTERDLDFLQYKMAASFDVAKLQNVVLEAPALQHNY